MYFIYKYIALEVYESWRIVARAEKVVWHKQLAKKMINFKQEQHNNCS